jgi:aspartate/glutamate racemase
MPTKKTKKGPGPDVIITDGGKKGLLQGLGILGGMGAAATAAFLSSRRPKEERLASRALTQGEKATRKEARAAKLTEKGASPKRVERLTTKAKNLRTKSAANTKKAADIIIYKSKNK